MIGADLCPGTVLHDRYVVDRLLARGGSSVIYVGHPLRGAGRVAVKQLRPTSEADREDDLRQFRREHELLESLRHPSLPHVLEFFEEGETWYLIEELVPGRTLREVMEDEHRLPWARALAVSLSLLDVLGWLHRHQVVYRDLQPANVLLTPSGEARLIDLGAARRWRPDATRDTVPLGTPGFAAPEQYGLCQTDGRADIYSVAALLHYMLTGREPDGSWRFDPPDALDVPAGLSEVVMTALHLDPARRPQSVERMAEALLCVDEARARPFEGGARLLRLYDPDPWPYLARQFPRSLIGPSIGALTVPAWLTSALLWPVPLVVGAGVGLVTTLPAHIAWRRWRNVVAEVWERGARVFAHEEWWEAHWDEVERVRLTLEQESDRLLHAQFSAGSRAVELGGDWPSLRRLVEEVIARAGLGEDLTPFWADAYVGTYVRSFARQAPGATCGV